jgi:hypothetical protein
LTIANTLIEQIRERDTTLAETLSRLTAEFKYDTILSAFQHITEPEGGTA